MNRDELRSRALALPPRIYRRGRILAAYPSEPEGGTWIGVNGLGLLFALLNWNLDDHGAKTPKEKSRGELIPQLVFNSSLESVGATLHPRDLRGMLPFRLIGIESQALVICEWRWNGESLTLCRFPWLRRHWFSSSLSDRIAEQRRGGTCGRAGEAGDPQEPDWLVNLHRSHHPRAGAYSVCVHRPEAATLSYTEVIFGLHHVLMRYIGGSPCESTGFHYSLELQRSFGHHPHRARCRLSPETFSLVVTLIP